MNLFKRLKNLYTLSEYVPSDPDGFTPLVKQVYIEPRTSSSEDSTEFLGEGTEIEFSKQEREDEGLGGIFGL